MARRKAHKLRDPGRYCCFTGKTHACPGAQIPRKIKGSPSQNRPGLPIENRFERRLRSTALTVPVLVIFFVVLTLTALLWLLLSGLTALLALSGLARLVVLSGLPALLALSGLTSLLALFLHIVCHEYPSYKA